MKKFLLLFMTAAVIFALSSCDEQQHKKQKKYKHKERHERRW